MDIDPEKEEDQDSTEEFYNIVFFFSGEDMKEAFSHNRRGIMAYDSEYILDPFIDTLPDSRVDSLVVKLHGTCECGQCKSSVGVFFIGGCGICESETIGVRYVVVSDNVRGTLVYERKSPDDDVGRDSRLKKWEDVRDEHIVFFGHNNLPETKMEVVIVSLSFFLVFFGSLDSGERFGCFRSGRFGLLLSTTLRFTFVTIESIETVESHSVVVSY